MDEVSQKHKNSEVKKKSKTGPLKSSPGFLKCMRSVYLYFKEEKEKGALNIPINSFIERTAVAYGVGRKTLYNYAKKGLFDEHPAILQTKRRKKTGKQKGSRNDDDDCDICGHEPTVSSTAKRKRSRSVLIQTDPPAMTHQLMSSNSSITNKSDSRLLGYLSDAKQNGLEKVGFLEASVVQNVPPTETVPGPWAGGTSARRDIDYFTKTNIWQNVYSINNSDPTNSTAELVPTRMGNCQPSTTAMTEL